MHSRFYHHTVQIQPAPDYQYQQNFMQKPKSWDNLAPKGVGGYGFGYGFVDNSGNAVLPPRNVKVHHHMPVAHPDTGNYGKIVQSQPACPNVVRKNVYQHYGTTSVPGAGQCVQAAGGTAVSTAATGLSGQYVSSTTTTIITATSAQTPASEGCSAKCVKSTIACDQGKGCKWMCNYHYYIIISHIIIIIIYVDCQFELYLRCLYAFAASAIRYRCFYQMYRITH